MQRSKDGHRLFLAVCSGCNKNRGLVVKKLLNKLCRSCSAKTRINIACQNAVKAREVKTNNTQAKYNNVDLNNLISLPCGVYKYKTVCLKCNQDKGYQVLQNSQLVCRQCYELTRKSTIENNQKRLKKGIASSLYHRLKSRGIVKKSKTLEILGCSLDELRKHLESKFQEGMTWDNYGKWHVDHIIPDSWFTYSSVEDEGFKNSWTLSNLQPLWAADNISKGDRFAG